MQQKHKEIISLTILSAIYLISMPYHMMAVVLFSIGITIILVSFLQKLSGKRPAWNSIARIYLTVGLAINFFYILYFHLERVQGSM